MDTAEISRQANRLREQAKCFKVDCNQISNNIRICQENVHDDNYELSQALKKVNERFIDLAGHVENQYNQLVDVMLAYCYKSDDSSRMANVELEKLNAQLDEMLAMQL